MELATGLLFWHSTHLFGLSLLGVVYALFGSLLLVISAIDWEWRIIPDVLSLPGCALGIMMSSTLTSVGVRLEWGEKTNVG